MSKKKYSNGDFRKGNVPWNLGMKMSVEAREKMSKAKKGKPSGRTPMKGKHHSEETKKKMSEAHKGKKRSAPRTIEHKRKLSLVAKGRIPWNRGVHMSDEVKRRISKSRKGKCEGVDHWNWKGGTRSKGFEQLYGISMYEWRKLSGCIRKRDSHTCFYCGKSPVFVVHHIIPRSFKIDNSPSNLITVCGKCHRKTESFTNKFLLLLIDKNIINI